MKDKIFGVLQRVGRSFMLPIALLPIAGILLGLGSVFTNETTLATYHLTAAFGPGTFMHGFNTILLAVGNAVFGNLPVLFALGVAIGMAKKEKEVSALAGLIGYIAMNTAINGMLRITGQIDADGKLLKTAHILPGAITQTLGITSLQMGVFGGIIVGLGVAALHNRFYKIELPNAISFFGGSRFVPIIATLVYTFVGIGLYFVWPPISAGINALGVLVAASGPLGTLAFGIIKRALIPFGLHHVFYMPFWQTAVGGTMKVGGKMIEGGQNIFFAQLANAGHIRHFSADATRYFSGEFIFMIFGLPGAALAMYRTAKPEKRKAAGGLLLSAALASMLTGITEPIEFSFLFVAPMLFGVQVLLAGSCYMLAHLLNVAVGVTFSGGLIDLIFFGVLQGNAKTSWLLLIPCGIVYFLLYYLIFRFLIVKFDLKTPGREDDDAETKLYSKADYQAKKGEGGAAAPKGSSQDALSADIVRGLGGKANITDVDACATRLRITVKDPGRVTDAVLKATGAAGVVHKGQGIQVIYGPQVSVIKSNLEEYLLSAPDQPAPVSEEAPAPTPVPEEAPAPVPKKRRLVKVVKIASPFTGVAHDLGETPDEGFAGKIMGDGAMVEPEENILYAPEDGVIALVFDTKHAIGLTTDSGVGLLIHVGIDTVALGGKGFKALVETGQRVKKGDPLLEVDLDYLRANAPSLATPVMDTEMNNDKTVRLLANGPVQAGEPLFAIDYYEDVPEE
ncbi:glucose PTS transporter subunit IIA [Pseudoramibacter alactolyticus]|uniref:PTS transporter subunit IIABC n=1 Tax=Pseudoramibacter alactolyticus TaxID=113287 RepID=UPI0028E872A9|nr:glucose PTS transporter subunit IIA [Pseudoramibacter alactolyticus]